MCFYFGQQNENTKVLKVQKHPKKIKKQLQQI
jgi:hypothetical protein